MLGKYRLIVYLVAFFSVCKAEDVVIQMFSKKPINVISDKYISFSIDPTELLEMNQEESFLYRMLEMGPCFLKIYGNNTNNMRLDGDSIDLNASKLSLERLKSVYEIMRSAGIRPVISLPYDPARWNTRNIMRILGKISLLEMNDITWQLGADLHTKDAISYIDDLNTLRLIVGAFSTKSNRKNWSVVGSDMTIGSSEYEARMFSEFSKYIVDAVGWSQSTELSYSDENVDDFFSSVNIDPALRTLLNGDAPVWLSLLKKTDVDTKHPLTQMKEGLNWAQTLGDAARNGFKVIYTPINKKTWYESSMNYYTTLLHKRIIGQTVFDTKIFNGNRFDTHFYAHCTKNMSGSFSIFGVNAADTVLDITAKLPFRSGTQFVEFILTVGVNGQVYMNGAEIIEPTVLTPLARSKLPGKSALLSMPAHSVAFWVFTSASIPECASTEEISFDIDRPEEKTSSEHLLQELILETVSKDERKSDFTHSKSMRANDNFGENSIPRSNQSPNEMPNTRHRRDTENSIDKHSEYNAIETNAAVDDKTLDEQTRGKRFIGDTNLVNRIFNDIDDMKRAHLLAPFKNKMGLPSKRMKREINMLRNLFDKFDLKKPVFNFKSPSLKMSTKGLIPSISTVHDVLNSAVDPSNQERKIFEAIENPDLPTGDVHFELTENSAPTNEYAASLADGNHVIHQLGDGSPSVASVPSLDVYSNAGESAPVGVMPSTNTYPLTPNNYGELTEIDVKPEVVTSAPASVAVANVQAANVQPLQHYLPYVVKDLPPTWQVNLQNMERARQNLRQNLWPMGTQNANVNVAAPNIAPSMIIQPMNVQPDNNVEHVFFESKRRRRRAIDARMNDEIEERVHSTVAMPPPTKNELRFGQDIDQIEFFDKMARFFDDMERNQNSMHKTGNGIRKILASKRSNSLENDVPKKCKVLSMAMERQCLQSDDSDSRPIFKRSAANILKRPMGVLKKIVEKVRSNVQAPLKKLREKRSIRHLSDKLDDDESANLIIPDVDLNELNAENVPKKIVYHRQDFPKPSITSTTSTAQPIKTMENDRDDVTAKPVPKVRKLLRTVNGHVNRFVNSVLGHVSSLWFLV